MTDTLAALRAHANADVAAGKAAYHKTDRTVLGVSNPQINDLTKLWRRTLDLDTRLAEAQRLWKSEIFEARIAAAKLLTQARIRPDAGVWDLIVGWVPDFDGWAIADHVAAAGARRLVADPARLDTVEAWTQSDQMWTRRAALVFTLPWAKQNHPTGAELAVRDRVLGWAAAYTADDTWFIQKAVAWWVRDLSKHDGDRARAFLHRHGAALRPFARREAARHLP